MTGTPDICIHIAKRIFACLMRIRWYLWELHDQTEFPLSLKTRMVKAEAIKALLYGCSTWTLRQKYYDKLCIVHHWFVLRIIGAQRNILDLHMTSYNRTLKITRCKSIEILLRTKLLLEAGALICMGGGRLPKGNVFGTLQGAVRRVHFETEKEWTNCVLSDIRVFGINMD